MLTALEENGQAANTVVVYAADHGLGLGSHGLLGKQNLYEHSMRCPLIVRGPGIPQGSTDAFTYLFDLFPTLLGLGSAETPPGIDGRDLAALWSGRRRHGLAPEPVPAVPGPDARGARRAVQADRLPEGQPPAAVRPGRRSRRVAQSRGRPRARADPGPARSAARRLESGDGRCGAARDRRSVAAPARSDGPRTPARPLAAAVAPGTSTSVRRLLRVRSASPLGLALTGVCTVPAGAAAPGDVE